MTTNGISLKRGKDGRIMHPNSLANLPPTQWPKGVSGNNGGNGYSLKAELKHALRDKEKRKELIDSTIAGAILREPTPFKEVWDRVEGKLTDNLPLAGQDNRVVNFVFILPDGTKVSPRAFIEVANGNSRPASDS